jgi:hypothetical protein
MRRTEEVAFCIQALQLTEEKAAGVPHGLRQLISG